MNIDTKRNLSGDGRNLTAEPIMKTLAKIDPAELAQKPELIAVKLSFGTILCTATLPAPVAKQVIRTDRGQTKRASLADIG
jgi:hypothetical protein